MNNAFTKTNYKQIRTIAENDGRLAALKYIRIHNVENYTAAKNALNDILSNRSWTRPEIMADINAIREEMSIR